jgi:hypothetical protein
MFSGRWDTCRKCTHILQSGAVGASCHVHEQITSASELRLPKVDMASHIVVFIMSHMISLLL